MKKNQRIKLILDLIDKKRVISPEKETFQFQYKEFMKFPVLNDQIMLNQLFKRIQKESDCIVFIIPKWPEYLLGKSIVERGSKGAAFYGIINNLRNPNNKEDIIELDAETIKSFSTITIHIEDFKKFNKYHKKIEKELKEENIPVLILNDKGELYKMDDKEKNLVYSMALDKLPYKLIHYLVIEKYNVQTSILANEFTKSPQEIRKTIGEIRGLIENRLKVPAKKIIENNNSGNGYRVRNIKLKDNR